MTLLVLAGCTQVAGRADLASDQRSFQANCAVCHGADGLGAGPMGRELLAMPPGLMGLSEKNGGVFPAQFVLGVVEGHGRDVGLSGAMPDFAGAGMGTGSVVDVPGVARPVSADMADPLV